GLSPLPQSGVTVKQDFRDILEGEPSGSGAGYKLVHQLLKLPLAFRVVPPDLTMRNERTGALLRFQHTTNLQLPVGAQYGVGIDGQIYRHLANGGKLMSRPQRARGHTGLHLIDNLPVDRYTTLEIECESKRRWRIG